MMNISLNKRDRICFFGDSITSQGTWISEIYQYFINNYHELEIMFFNCGVMGSRGSEANVKNRMYCDLFNYFPKYVVIMFGMNDIDINLYGLTCNDENKEKLRENKILQYKSSLDNIIKLCKKECVTPIICSPTPYDEYSNVERENLHADTALMRCSNIAATVAEENSLLFVDLREIIMQHINDKPIGEDRIHPNDFGHHLMAEKFLKSIGAKEKIEKDKVCSISTYNKKRYEIEQKLRTIAFIERDCMGWQFEDFKPLCERKIEILNKREAILNKREAIIDPVDKWFENIYDIYLKYSDFCEELFGELILINSNMYCN